MSNSELLAELDLENAKQEELKLKISKEQSHIRDQHSVNTDSKSAFLTQPNSFVEHESPNHDNPNTFFVKQIDLTARSILEQYRSTRTSTMQLTKNLTAEDMVAQSMPDASPVKWHLAHTTWFFETFILKKYIPDFSWFNEQYCHLFNSYYESVGSRHARPQRGLLTRPSLSEVINYREHVDILMMDLLSSKHLSSHNIDSGSQHADRDILFLTTVGLHHEMQHQELLQTDVCHLLWHNPIYPQVRDESPLIEPLAPLNTSSIISQPLNMISFEGGLVSVGAELGATEFNYDCESPTHQVFLQPFSLANRLITNAEWLEFIQDGGYQNSMLWLSDGWAMCQKENWQAPLYWQNMSDCQKLGPPKLGAQKQKAEYFQFGLDGMRPLKSDAPVCHISFYEADAFARWKGKRLPKEHEWELAASQIEVSGNFLESDIGRPLPAKNTNKLSQLYGDVWEWTQSSFSPYPGFEPALGSLGEYNGKFMSNQYVLRGGSCATPVIQLRPTYRNFFYPHHRWQYSGLRLAEDQ